MPRTFLVKRRTEHKLQSNDIGNNSTQVKYGKTAIDSDQSYLKEQSTDVFIKTSKNTETPRPTKEQILKKCVPHESLPINPVSIFRKVHMEKTYYKAEEYKSCEKICEHLGSVEKNTSHSNSKKTSSCDNEVTTNSCDIDSTKNSEIIIHHEPSCGCQPNKRRRTDNLYIPEKMETIPFKKVLPDKTAGVVLSNFNRRFPRYPLSQQRSKLPEPACSCPQCILQQKRAAFVPECYCKGCRLKANSSGELSNKLKFAYREENNTLEKNTNTFPIKTVRTVEVPCTLACCRPCSAANDSSQNVRRLQNEIKNGIEPSHTENYSMDPQLSKLKKEKKILCCRLCEECCGCDLPRRDIICCQNDRQKSMNEDFSVAPVKGSICVCTECRSSVERFVRETVTVNGRLSVTTHGTLSDSEGSIANDSQTLPSQKLSSREVDVDANRSLSADDDSCKCDRCVQHLDQDSKAVQMDSSEKVSSPSSVNKPTALLFIRDGKKSSSEDDISDIHKSASFVQLRARKNKVDNKQNRKGKLDFALNSSYNNKLSGSLSKSRLLANLLERRRVAELNQAFDQLRGIVPCYGNEDRTLSKIKTLRYAITYIAHLAMISEKQIQEGYYNVKTEFPKLFDRDPLLQKCQEHLESHSVI